jgi:Na+/H+ antiporter NhaD/arsenite permease-like protein
LAILSLAGVCTAGSAYGAEVGPALDGSTLSLWWIVPFLGLLLSIAALPQLSPRLWHRNFGKIAAAWALLFLVPLVATRGVAFTADKVLHVALGEYLPFIILLFALFVISGGIRVRSNMIGTPAVNVGILAFGAAIASLTGTTGAAMLLVRPLIQANLKRRHNAHVRIRPARAAGTFGWLCSRSAELGGGSAPVPR